MIKRDIIQRIRVIPTDDTQGGSSGVVVERYEKIKAHCSVFATGEQIAQFGVTTQKMVNVITDIKLDEYVNTRYIFNGDVYKLMRQVQRGREWFSVLMEVAEEVELNGNV